MLPALQFLDPVIGVDFHVLPTSGPVPVPVLFVGMLGDWKDLIASNYVAINYRPRVQAGTTGFGWHFHPSLSTQRKPDGKAEVLLGSSTVLVEGKPMAYGPGPVLTCHGVSTFLLTSEKLKGKTVSMLPLAASIPIPSGNLVFVGGAPIACAIPFLERVKSPPVLFLCKMLRKARCGRAARWARYGLGKYDWLKKGADLGGVT